MKIPALPFTVTDWAALPPTHHPGETGQATWRTFNIGDLRVRLVDYSPGYRADHWCDRGHVLYVLEGGTRYRAARWPDLSIDRRHELSGLGSWRRSAPYLDNERRPAV